MKLRKGNGVCDSSVQISVVGVTWGVADVREPVGLSTYVYLRRTPLKVRRESVAA